MNIFTHLRDPSLPHPSAQRQYNMEHLCIRYFYGISSLLNLVSTIYPFTGFNIFPALKNPFFHIIILAERRHQTCRFFFFVQGIPFEAYTKKCSILLLRGRGLENDNFPNAPLPCRFFVQSVFYDPSNALSILLHLTLSRVKGVNRNFEIRTPRCNFSSVGPIAVRYYKAYDTFRAQLGQKENKRPKIH